MRNKQDFFAKHGQDSSLEAEGAKLYDIVIVGGGPAGSTLARLLEKSYQVLLLDKRNLRSKEAYTRRKCCGGLLAPDAQKVLAQMGLGLPKEVLLAPQVFSVKALDYDYHESRCYQRHYINVDREGFDRWLFSLVPEHVEIRDECLLKGYREVTALEMQEIEDQGYAKMEDEWLGKGPQRKHPKTGMPILEVQWYDLKTRQTQKAFTRLLVGADGGSSLVRRTMAAGKPQPKRYVSVQRWYETRGSLPHFISLFDREISDFYCWAIQKEDHLLVGAALEDGREVEARLDKVVEHLRSQGYDLGRCFRREGAWIMRPQSLQEIHLSQGPVALVGEAAGWISPSSAEGISYALRSAGALAEALGPGLEGYQERYKKKAGKLYVAMVGKLIKAPVYTSFLRGWIMRSGLLSIKMSPDDRCKAIRVASQELAL